MFIGQPTKADFEKQAYEKINELYEKWIKEKNISDYADNSWFPYSFGELFFGLYFFVRLKDSGCIYEIGGHRLSPTMRKIGPVKGFEKMSEKDNTKWEELTGSAYISSRPSIRSFYGKSADEISAYMFDKARMYELISDTEYGPYITLFDNMRRGIVIPAEYREGTGKKPSGLKKTQNFKSLIEEVSGYGFSRLILENGCDARNAYKTLSGICKSCEFMYRYLRTPKTFPSLFGRISILILSGKGKHIRGAADYGTYIGRDTIRIKEWTDNVYFHEWMHAFDTYYCHFDRDRRYTLSFKFDNEFTQRDAKATRLREVILGNSKKPSVMLKDAKFIDSHEDGSGAYYSLPDEMYARAFACYMTEAAARENKDGRYGSFHPNIMFIKRFCHVQYYSEDYLDYLDEIDESIGDDPERDEQYLYATAAVRYSQEPVVYSAFRSFFDEFLSTSENLIR